NLFLNPNYGFYFYFLANLVILGFFTLFNFMELNYVKNNFLQNDLKIFKLFNLISLGSILFYVLFYFISNNTNENFNIILYIYSLNVLMFGYFGFKNFKTKNIILLKSK